MKTKHISGKHNITKNEKKTVTIERRKLCVKDSIVASLPFLIGTFMFLFMTALFMAYITQTFESPFLELIMLMFVMFVLPQMFNKIVPMPTTTYEVMRITEDVE